MVQGLNFLVNNGKTNQHGKIDCQGMLRHMFPWLCGVFGTAIYLFGRFHVNKEQPPNFAPVFDRGAPPTGRRYWVERALFVADNGASDEPLKYTSNYPKLPFAADSAPNIALFPFLLAQYAAWKRAHDGLGLALESVTHAMRKFGPREASKKGASNDALKQQGQWSQGVFSAVYNTVQPLKALVALAGFSADNVRAYFIPRSLLGGFFLLI